MKKITHSIETFLSKNVKNVSKKLLILGFIICSLMSYGQDVARLDYQYSSIKPNTYRGKILFIVPKELEVGVHDFGYLYKKTGISLVSLKRNERSMKFEVDKIISEDKEDDKIQELIYGRNVMLISVIRSTGIEYYTDKGLFITKLASESDKIVDYKKRIWQFTQNGNVHIVNDNGVTIFKQPKDNTVLNPNKEDYFQIYKDTTNGLWGVFDLKSQKTVIAPSFRKEELSYSNDYNTMNVRGKTYKIGVDEIPKSIVKKQQDYVIAQFINKTKGICFVKHPTKALFAIYDDMNDTLLHDFEITEFKVAMGIDKRIYGFDDFYSIKKEVPLPAFQFRNNDNKWGYIDEDDNYIPFKYEADCLKSTDCFANQNSLAYSLWVHRQACVRNPDNGKWGVVDVNNKELLSCSYDNIEYDYTYQDNSNISKLRDKLEGYAKEKKYHLVIKNGKYGVVGVGNNVLVPIEYDNLKSDLSGYNFIFRKNGKYGVVNYANNILPAEYDDIYTLYDGYCFRVQKGNKRGIVNFSGILVPIEYDEIKMYESDYSYSWKNTFYTYTKLGGKGIFNAKLGNFPNYSSAGERYRWLYVCNDKECKVYNNEGKFQTNVTDSYQAIVYIDNNTPEGIEASRRDEARRESAERDRQEEARKQAKQVEDAQERERRKSTPCVCSSCDGKGHHINKTSYTITKYVPTYDKNGASTGSKLVNIEVPEERKVYCGTCKGTGKCGQ
jgi:hypothetical protein